MCIAVHRHDRARKYLADERFPSEFARERAVSILQYEFECVGPDKTNHSAVPDRRPPDISVLTLKVKEIADDVLAHRSKMLDERNRMRGNRLVGVRHRLSVLGGHSCIFTGGLGRRPRAKLKRRE